MKFLTFDSEADWLEARRGLITSSDIPILLGEFDSKSPWDLWQEKVRGGSTSGDYYLMRRGHALEDFIASEYERDTGRKTVDPGDYAIAVHGQIEWAAATLDRLTYDPASGSEEPDGILEEKAPTQYGLHKYRKGADKYATAQAQWAMFVTGLTRGEVAVDFGTRLAIFPVKANRKLQAQLYAVAKRFRQYVLDETPPPADGHKATARAMARFFAEPVRPQVELSSEAMDRFDLRADCIRMVNDLERERTECENYFRELIGEAGAETGILPDGREIHWRPDKNGTRRLTFPKEATR